MGRDVQGLKLKIQNVTVWRLHTTSHLHKVNTPQQIYWTKVQ